MPARTHAAQSDLGIPVGAGTDVAMEVCVAIMLHSTRGARGQAADIVLIKNDLRDVITAFDLRRCYPAAVACFTPDLQPHRVQPHPTELHLGVRLQLSRHVRSPPARLAVSGNRINS